MKEVTNNLIDYFKAKQEEKAKALIPKCKIKITDEKFVQEHFPSKKTMKGYVVCRDENGDFIVSIKKKTYTLKTHQIEQVVFNKGKDSSNLDVLNQLKSSMYLDPENKDTLMEDVIATFRKKCLPPKNLFTETKSTKNTFQPNFKDEIYPIKKITTKV